MCACLRVCVWVFCVCVCVCVCKCVCVGARVCEIYFAFVLHLNILHIMHDIFEVIKLTRVDVFYFNFVPVYNPIFERIIDTGL